MSVCSKFHLSLFVQRYGGRGGVSLTQDEVHTLRSNLIKFYEGGVSLTEAKNMSLWELYSESMQAVRINEEIKAEVSKK